MAKTTFEEEELSMYAELFRSKLIEDFHLLESFDEEGRSDAPKFSSKDFEDASTIHKVMLESPNGLVKFQVYSRKEPGEITSSDRRRNRVKNKNSKNPPLDMWAHFVLESSIFQHFMLALILANSIALGIQAEVSGSDDPRLTGLKVALDIFDYCSLFMFMVEIILKWIDDFWIFWSDNWNIFDFIVTVGSFVPEIIALFAKDVGEHKVNVIVRNLRVFRILRSLKMVSRFRQVRLIALAIGKAFNAITFIMLLLFTFLYIFAITGIIFFDAYTRSERQDLIYQDSFKSLPRAMITLFQLFTLDQWYKFLMDLFKVMDPMLPLGYILLWICIGSFIFKNIFVGIMVNNFQSIRNELFEEVKEQEVARQIIHDTEKLNEELSRQEKMLNSKRRGTLRRGTIHGPLLPSARQNLTPGLPSEKREKTPGLSEIAEGEEEEDVEDDGNGATDAAEAEEDSRERGLSDSAGRGEEVGGDKNRPEEAPGTEEDSRGSATFSFDESHESLYRRSSERMMEADRSSFNWEKTVHDNLVLLTSGNMETLWPRDTLFKYFQLMEALMENLQERQDLQDLAYHALLQVFDTHEDTA